MFGDQFIFVGCQNRDFEKSRVFINHSLAHIFQSQQDMFSISDTTIMSTMKKGTTMEGVQIRSYNQATDYHECREIFTEGMQQLINLVNRVVFPRYLWYVAITTIFAILASVKWSLWILILSLSISLVLIALLYVDIYYECWKFIKYCLRTDLADIDKTYMCNEGCHMWVADLNGKVVGMVGLLVDEKQKPGVAELQRMSVSGKCRKMGVGRKLLEQVLRHAEQCKLSKIVLSTTSAQLPAIGLYKKYGFKLAGVYPYPQKILGDLEYWLFDRQL